MGLEELREENKRLKEALARRNASISLLMHHVEALKSLVECAARDAGIHR